MTEQRTAPSKHEERKARTRAALIKAAQHVIADGRENVALLEITQIADVGMGSFYNHFASKDELFQAAVDDALEAHADLLDRLAEDFDDPAEVFAQSFRLTGRLHRLVPELSRVLLSHGPALISSDRGLAPRALRDIENGVASGRFSVADPQVALMLAAGGVLALGQALHDDPTRDDAATTDQMTTDLLRMLGVPDDEARKICSHPLPGIDLPDLTI
ncbi:TetR/AcrR family transcriptional regulator [Nocardioides sp. CPCC 206347]|uniref:TetR/AcrR family transcriptional regulator n=1 Tax=unclassified Nocardioides TaxID=2615069 RepID=UPI00360F1555